MLKKTFYTVLALGAVITLGITTSAFVSADTTTETNVKSEAPFAGTWSAGTVKANGSIKEAGTGDWTVKKTGRGTYEVQGPATAKTLVATGYSDFVLTSATVISVKDQGNGRFEIKTVKFSLRDYYDLGFSFVIYSK